MTATGGYGGPVASLVTVLAELAPTGVTRVVCAPRAAKLAYWERLHDVSDVLIPMRRPRGAGIVEAQREVLAAARRHREAIEVVHANSLTELVVALPAAIALDLPIVVWAHNSEIPVVAQLARPVVRSLRDRVRFAAVSSFTRDLLVRAGFTTIDAARVIPNPIDLRVVPARRPAWDGPPRIGFLGRSARGKGFDLLPACIELLRDTPTRWEVFSTPFLEERSTWRQLLATPPELVSVNAMLPDASQAYARCDIVFVPSRLESFCRVAAEALLNGLPVVASDIPALREVLDDGRAGELFPVGDAEAAAVLLRDLVRDPERRAAIGSAGRQRAEAFQPERVTASLLHLYAEALRATASPS